MTALAHGVLGIFSVSLETILGTEYMYKVIVFNVDMSCMMSYITLLRYLTLPYLTLPYFKAPARSVTVPVPRSPIAGNLATESGR